MLKKLLFILVSMLFVVQASDKPISFEEFFEMPRLSDPVVSPDGQRIAFTITIFNVKKNNSSRMIRVIRPDGSLEKQISFPDKKVGSPVFGADGTLYFTSGGNIYSEKSESPVLDMYPQAGGLVTANNGRYIAYAASIYPDGDGSGDQAIDEAKEQSPVKARIYDRLFYRHWNEWSDGKRSHVFLFDTRSKKSIDVTPGDFDSPPVGLGSGHDYVFSPESNEIAFVSNHDDVIATSTNNDVFVYSLTDKSTRKVSPGQGNDNHPVYSPDGKYLAFLSMERKGFEADRKRIMLYDRNSGSLKEVTKGFKLGVSELVWTPDSRFIYFTCDDQGYKSLFAVNIATGRIAPLMKNHYLSGLNMLPNGDLVFAVQSAQAPKEIFILKKGRREPQALSAVNKHHLSEMVLPEYESFWFEGAKGEKVQGFIMKPPLFEEGKKYPAIELIHGGPQGMFGDVFHYRWNYQMFASKGYVVFWINFHGSTGYGQDFTDAISGHWGDYPYEDIVKGTEYVLNTYDFIDKNKVGAAGASYGGFMINWIAGHDNPFKCLVSHDGVYDQVSMWGATEELWFPEWEFGGKPWDKNTTYDKWSPSRLAANFKTPTLVIHGEQDFRVPYTQGLQFFSALQRNGVPSKLLFFPDEDHFVQKPQNAQLWWKTVDDWFAKYLK